MLARFAFMTRAYRARVGPLVTRSMTPTRSLRTGACEGGFRGGSPTFRGSHWRPHPSKALQDGSLLTPLHSIEKRRAGLSALISSRFSFPGAKVAPVYSSDRKGLRPFRDPLPQGRCLHIACV